MFLYFLSCFIGMAIGVGGCAFIVLCAMSGESRRREPTPFCRPRLNLTKKAIRQLRAQNVVRN